MSRRLQFTFFILGIALLMLLTGFQQIAYPLWFDQSAFAACADVLRRGGLFFRDCWDARGPLTPALYAIPTLLSPTPAAIQTFNLLWIAATCIAVAALARRMFGQWLPALAAGALLWLMNLTLNYWSHAQAEGFANLFFVVAALFAWMATRQTSNVMRDALLSGVLAGALFWFKYPFAVFALFLALWLWWLERKRDGAKLAGALLLGASASIVAGALLILITGAWPDWLLHLRYALTQFNNVPLGERWHWLTGLFLVEVDAFVRVGSTPTAGFKDTVPQVEWLGRGYPIIILLMVIGAVGLLVAKAQRKAGALLAGWLVVAILLNIWQGHSYRYHFIIWLPAMALLASATLALRVPRWARVITSAGVMVVMAGLFAALWPWMRDGYDNILVRRASPAALYLQSREAPMWQMADFLRQNVRAGERIAIFSDAPDVYFLSQLPNATRFPYARWAAEARDPAMRDALAQIYFDELTRNPPRYFILTKDGFPYAEARFIETWKSLPAINRYIEDNYQFIGENGPFLLFERR
jgi:hypothetical protein